MTTESAAKSLISTVLPSMAAKATDKVMAMVVDKVDGIVNIERDISNLQTTLRMIQGIVQLAEEKQIDNVYIQNWLRDLVDIGYEARDVLDDFITAEEASNPVNFISSLMLSCFSGFCGSSSDTSKLPLAILNRLEKDIRSVRERFDEKKKEGENFAILKSVVGEGSESSREYRRPQVGHSINQQTKYPFLGRENVKEGIMKKILHPSDNAVHLVAIWGMGGIGKTTLAQFIYNDERVKEDEYPTKNRKWLGVGEKKLSAEKVIREIVNDQNTVGIGNLQTKLEKELSGDRFLIVLDDVWDVDGSEWDLLFNPLTNVGKGLKGGLIIITTRKREVCTLTKTQTTYDLKPLSEQDSWLIFESFAYVNGKCESTPDLKDTGKEIVKRVNGLPLALKVVGCSLLDKDFSTWTNFLEFKLAKDDEVMSALRWSYNHLPQNLKSCFTYCALFPKDHVFDEKVLVEMWMAHDLVQTEEKIRLEDVGDQYFKKLVNASLLQCVDGKYVMHDLIHDLATVVSNGEFASANSSLSNDQMEKVRHITIIRDYSENLRLCKSKRILTLYTIPRSLWGASNRTCFDIDVLLDDFKSSRIRVLVLSQAEITKIPDCISELKHLRYLDVSETNVRRLPDSLCHLYNLQMLAVPHHAELPKDIVNMVNLRYLRANLSTCKGVGKLTSLQELSSIHVCEGDNIRELGGMQLLRGQLTIRGLENVTSKEDAAGALMEKQANIDRLRLLFDKENSGDTTISQKVLNALGCPPNLRYLQIVGYNGVNPPRWMVDGKHKVDKLQTLELSHCLKLEYLPPLGELNFLKDLSLQHLHGVKRLGDKFYGNFIDNKVFFPSLESLLFSDMEGWRVWDVDIINNSSMSFFPRLTRLEIKHCAKLVLALPIMNNGNYFMTSLSRLEISYCDGLERLQLDALVSLKNLDISHCKSLVEITSGICLVTTIERLKISQCQHLETMDFERLPSLKSLDIRTCNKLISVPCVHGAILEWIFLHTCESLKTLTFNIIDGLDSLKDLTILGCPVLELAFLEGSSSSHSSGKLVAVRLCIYTDKKQIFTKLFEYKFVSLETLKITFVTEFENFNETEENNFYELKSLKILHISTFKDLKSLPAHFHKLSSLKSLKIDNCPKLLSFPRDFHEISSLKNLKIISCRQLESLPPYFHKLTSLESLYISNCPKLRSLHPNLHTLSSLNRLHIQDCPQIKSIPPNFHKLSSLKSLHIEYFPQLQSLPQNFHKLPSLEKLHIKFCERLRSLPALGLPRSIESLKISDCPLLWERCKNESSPDWQRIEHIHDIRLSSKDNNNHEDYYDHDPYNHDENDDDDDDDSGGGGDDDDDEGYDNDHDLNNNHKRYIDGVEIYCDYDDYDDYDNEDDDE